MALHIMCRAFFSAAGYSRGKEAIMKTMTLRKHIAKWRKDRELNKILRALDASLQDLPGYLENTWFYRYISGVFLFQYNSYNKYKKYCVVNVSIEKGGNEIGFQVHQISDR